MSNLAIQQHDQSAAVSQWTPSQVELIKQQIAVGCSDGELALFGQVCNRTGLDPFTRQIYAVVRPTWNAATRQKEPKMTIQLSIDGFRTIAARSGFYAGSQTYWCGEDGVWLDVWLRQAPPSAAKTEVYRKGCDRPFVGVARFNAYAQKKVSGELSGQWPTMPDVMIGKCSEALALRKAFPGDLSGFYSTEEMEQAGNPLPEQASGMATALDLAPIIKTLTTAGLDEAQRREWLKEQGFSSPGRIPLEEIPRLLASARILEAEEITAHEGIGFGLPHEGQD